MSHRRSKRKRSPNFYCARCQQRLWRLGSPKHFLFYQEASDIRVNLKVPRKNALLLAAKGICVDQKAWIEELFCSEHGKVWMLVRKQDDGTFTTIPAKSQDWERTTKTLDPDLPNPSVSEFTYRMSRRAGKQSTNLRTSQVWER